MKDDHPPRKEYRGDNSKSGGVKRKAEKAILNSTRQSSRTYVIVYPGKYKAKTRLPAAHKDTLEDIQEQEIMADIQQDRRGEA